MFSLNRAGTTGGSDLFSYSEGILARKAEAPAVLRVQGLVYLSKFFLLGGWLAIRVFDASENQLSEPVKVYIWRAHLIID